MKITEILFESNSESEAINQLKKDLIAAKKKGVKLDYDGVGKIMEKIWNKYNMTGQKLHDIFVKEVGLIPDTWIKKVK